MFPLVGVVYEKVSVFSNKNSGSVLGCIKYGLYN